MSKESIRDSVIPKAKDAYDMTCTNINMNLSYELHRIGDLIKEAIKKGEFELKLYNETIPNNIKFALENNGYTVKTQSAMNETDTTISWKEPDKVYRDAKRKTNQDPCKKCNFEPKYSCTGCAEKIAYERNNKENK